MTDENQFKRVEWTDDGWQPSDDDGADGLPIGSRGPGLPADDLELLTLAARALGARAEPVEGEQWVALHFADGKVEHGWNPLRHSDDALALAVRLHIVIAPMPAVPHEERPSFTAAYTYHCPARADEPHENDALAATRRAITRAAAEIGKGIA